MNAALRVRCPDGYRPGCSCDTQALEPSEDCHVHGWPDPRPCEYCKQFVALAVGSVCKRCGWRRGAAPEVVLVVDG